MQDGISAYKDIHLQLFFTLIANIKFFASNKQVKISPGYTNGYIVDK